MGSVRFAACFPFKPHSLLRTEPLSLNAHSSSSDASEEHAKRAWLAKMDNANNAILGAKALLAQVGFTS